MNLKSILRNDKLFLAAFILLFSILALFIHRDVIFNPYSYGRHWDWSFLSSTDLYVTYLKQFVYTISPSVTGDYGSIVFTDFLVKFFVLIVAKTAPILSVPVISKLTIFLVFPLVSSLGIFLLCKSVLVNVYKSNRLQFFVIAVFANLLYTFSLPVMVDLHGGAINRLASTILFPYFSLAIYRYYKSTSEKLISRELLTVSLFFILFDISNIFYCAVMTGITILLKNLTLKQKFIQGVVVGILILILNFYWIQGLFLNNNVDVQKIIAHKRTSAEALAFNSSSYSEALFLLDSQQHIAAEIFKNNPLVYVPYFFYYLVVLSTLVSIRHSIKDRRLVLGMFGGYLFATVLVTGPNSIGNLYSHLYSLHILTFIEIAQRFLPNLAMYMVFIMLVVLSVRYEHSSKETRWGRSFFYIPICLWIMFLLTNGNLVRRVYTTYKTEYERLIPNIIFLNQQIGALYANDTTVLSLIRKHRLIYNVLPIPSYFYPTFIDNVYPPDSQGSDTENFYSKGMLITNHSASYNLEFINSFIRYAPSQNFFQFFNIGYIWDRSSSRKDLDYIESSFTNKWVAAAQKNDGKSMKKTDEPSFYQADHTYFTPVIYGSQENVLTTKMPKEVATLSAQLNVNNSSAIFFQTQNGGKDLSFFDNINNRSSMPVLEFNEINSTRYLVIAHGVRADFPLVLSKRFYDGWKMSPIKYQISSGSSYDLLDYKILEGNSGDQATKEELGAFIQKGWVSTLGDGMEKKFTHLKYVGNHEFFDKNELYNIDYISKNFKNTIQNNNLKSVGSEIKGQTIGEDKHLLVNGYANAWIINVDDICKNDFCSQNKDGSYDIALNVEFTPQRTYAKGMLLSFGTLLALLYYIVIRKKHE